MLEGGFFLMIIRAQIASLRFRVHQDMLTGFAYARSDGKVTVRGDV